MERNRSNTPLSRENYLRWRNVFRIGGPLLLLLASITPLLLIIGLPSLFEGGLFRLDADRWTPISFPHGDGFGLSLVDGKPCLNTKGTGDDNFPCYCLDSSGWQLLEKTAIPEPTLEADTLVPVEGKKEELRGWLSDDGIFEKNPPGSERKTLPELPELQSKELISAAEAKGTMLIALGHSSEGNFGFETISLHLFDFAKNSWSLIDCSALNNAASPGLILTVGDNESIWAAGSSLWHISDGECAQTNHKGPFELAGRSRNKLWLTGSEAVFSVDLSKNSVSAVEQNVLTPSEISEAEFSVFGGALYAGTSKAIFRLDPPGLQFTYEPPYLGTAEISDFVVTPEGVVFASWRLGLDWVLAAYGGVFLLALLLYHYLRHRPYRYIVEQLIEVRSRYWLGGERSRPPSFAKTIALPFAFILGTIAVCWAADQLGLRHLLDVSMKFMNILILGLPIAYVVRHRFTWGGLIRGIREGRYDYVIASALAHKREDELTSIIKTEALLLSGQWDAALAECSFRCPKKLKPEPEKHFALLHQTGRALIGKGQIAEAKTLLRLAADCTSTSRAAHLALLQLMLETDEDLESTFALLKETRNQRKRKWSDPFPEFQHDSLLHALSAWYYARGNDFGKADKEMAKALKKTPRNSRPVQARLCYVKLQLERLRGTKDGALLHKIRQIDPQGVLTRQLQ